MDDSDTDNITTFVFGTYSYTCGSDDLVGNI